MLFPTSINLRHGRWLLFVLIYLFFQIFICKRIVFVGNSGVVCVRLALQVCGIKTSHQEWGQNQYRDFCQHIKDAKSLTYNTINIRKVLADLLTFVLISL